MGDEGKKPGWIGLPDMSVKDEKAVESLDEKQKRKQKDSVDTTTKHVAEEGRSGLREGDVGLGRPLGDVKELSELSDKDKESIRQSVEEEQEKIAGAIVSEVDGVKIPGFFFRSTFILAVLLLGSLLGLYLTDQIITILEKISHLPQWTQYVWYSVLGIMAAVVLISLLRFSYLFIKAARSPTIRLKGLTEIYQRQSLRNIATREMTKVREILTPYLEEYHLEGKDSEKSLKILGFKDEEIKVLQQQRRRLLDPNISPDTEEWITNFKQRFQSMLDQGAERRTSVYAKKVAIRTGVNPTPLVDTLIVLFYSFFLIGDLFKIYNLRTDNFSTLVVLGRIFRNSYLASAFEEYDEVAAEMSEPFFTSLISTCGEALKLTEQIAPFIGTAAGVMGNASTKVAQGLANALLIRRLGRATIKMVKPIVD